MAEKIKKGDMTPDELQDALEDGFAEMSVLFEMAERMSCEAASKNVPGAAEVNIDVTEARGLFLQSKAAATRAARGLLTTIQPRFGGK